MINLKETLIAMALLGGGFIGSAHAAVPATGEIVATEAYRWAGDTIYQDEFKAWAEGPYEIRSNYKGRPGYFMPVEQTWRRKNNLSSYPVLTTPNLLHTAIYNMGLDEMVNAVEPDTTLRTGKEWAGVWTRDVSYSIILSMAALQPEASMISLMKKVNPSGQIIQDTGSGGAWPISTDRMIWVLAAWEVYKVTGDKAWLQKIYPIAERSIEKDSSRIMSEEGLVKGETSFIDWREQSYPKWMQTADISQSEAMNTNVLYSAALEAMADMSTILGKKKEAAIYSAKALALAKNIEKKFWMPDKGYLAMYTYGRDNKIVNPRAETLGESLAILYDVVSPDKAKSISENNPQTPYGAAIFYPQIADMPSYHNNALWPFVASYWTLAQAKAGNEQGVLEGMGSVFRPAALFATNKENFNLDNGDYFTELNSSNMLWSLAGNLAITNRILFGINFDKDGLLIKPFVPEALGGERTLANFPYRGEKLSITVKGYGDAVASLTLNGKKLDPTKVIPAKDLKKGGEIVVEMDNEPIPAMKLNRVANLKAPLTPQAWLTHSDRLDSEYIGLPVENLLQWNPIEYIAEYAVLRDGKEVARTRQTEYPALNEGEWQVIGYASDGTPSFASEPRSNRKKKIIDFPYERLSMVSNEISYPSKGTPEGFYGVGFVESDRKSGVLMADIDVDDAGLYTLAVRYANGNGPVNTENKAAVRVIFVNGKKAGTLVLPQRGVGNWNDWGMSNTVRTYLKKGLNKVMIEYRPADENMNIKNNHALLDAIVVEKVE